MSESTASRSARKAARRRPRGAVVDPHAGEAIRLQLEAAHVVRTVFGRGVDRLAQSVEAAVEILDVMADLVADEEGDPCLGLRPELGHQPIGRRGPDKHRLIAAAVGRPIARIKPVAIGRREARHELHADSCHLHGTALHQPAPGGDGIFARPGDDGAQPKLGRRDAAIGIERIGGHPKGAGLASGSIASPARRLTQSPPCRPGRQPTKTEYREPCLMAKSLSRSITPMGQPPVSEGLICRFKDCSH